MFSHLALRSYQVFVSGFAPELAAASAPFKVPEGGFQTPSCEPETGLASKRLSVRVSRGARYTRPTFKVHCARAPMPVRLSGCRCHWVTVPKKKTCLEMGGAGEADARLTFGRSAQLGRLLVVVNHRVLPSSPLVGRVSGSSSARTRV